jgi:hypothetical protein
MIALEQAHKQELREMANRWNNLIIPNFENEIALLEMELKKRQQLELDAFREQIEQGAAQITRVHWSNQVLDLEKRLHHLSSCGQYRDAKALKRTLKELKQEEKQKAMELARQKLLAKS